MKFFILREADSLKEYVERIAKEAYESRGRSYTYNGSGINYPLIPGTPYREVGAFNPRYARVERTFYFRLNRNFRKNGGLVGEYQEENNNYYFVVFNSSDEEVDRILLGKTKHFVIQISGVWIMWDKEERISSEEAQIRVLPGKRLSKTSAGFEFFLSDVGWNGNTIKHVLSKYKKKYLEGSFKTLKIRVKKI